MKSIAIKVLRRFSLLLGNIRIGDFIPVDQRGFWEVRSYPTRSLRKAAILFNQRGGETILEVGSGLHGKMSGNSIMVWAKHTSAKKIITIDLDEERIHEVKTATAQYPHVEARAEDGIEYLKQFSGKIDLLYLDFWTPDPEGEIPGTGRAQAYQDVYHAAKDKLNKHAMILIDDTDHVPPWKQTYIIPDARKDGFAVLYTGRQTLLQR